MSNRRQILVDLIGDILKDAVPAVSGRVFTQTFFPVDPKNVPCILVTREDETVEPLDVAPPTATRTLTIGVTILVKRQARDAEKVAEQSVRDIERALRELQFIIADDDSGAYLIEEFRQRNVSGIRTNGEAEKDYAWVVMTYEAIYVTDEGSRGEDGPGVPKVNVLGLLKRAVAKWIDSDGGEIALDDVNL